MSEQNQSKVYTYKITMVVEVVTREGEEHAMASLDERGGYMTERQVELISTTDIPRVEGVHSTSAAPKPNVQKMDINDLLK